MSLSFYSIRSFYLPFPLSISSDSSVFYPLSSLLFIFFLFLVILLFLTFLSHHFLFSISVSYPYNFLYFFTQPGQALCLFPSITTVSHSFYPIRSSVLSLLIPFRLPLLFSFDLIKLVSLSFTSHSVCSFVFVSYLTWPISLSFSLIFRLP